MRARDELQPSRIRLRLRRYPRLRAARAFALECRQAVTWSSSRVEDALEQAYASTEDPWDYRSAPEEIRRYRACQEMIAAVLGDRQPRALEIGCGEGLFTVKLAPLCKSVTGVDIVAMALARAKTRCAAFTNVRFLEWNLLSGPSIGRYDLVVCMDTISCLPPLERRRAIAQAANMVTPGGHLLASEFLMPAMVEQGPWGRFLPSGATHIIDGFGSSQTSLSRLETRLTGRHVVAVFASTTELG